MEISRRHLTEYVKELHQKACRTCSIIFPHSTNHIIDLRPCCCRCRRLKALANEDTLLPTQIFPRCGHKFCVWETKNVSDFVQKHFVSATNVSQFAQHGNTTFILTVLPWKCYSCLWLKMSCANVHFESRA